MHFVTSPAFLGIAALDVVLTLAYLFMSRGWVRDCVWSAGAALYVILILCVLWDVLCQFW